MPIESMIPSHPLSSPFSCCLQTFPASGSFPMSQLFASGGLFCHIHLIFLCVCVCFSVMPNSLWSHGHSLPDSSVHGILQTRIWEWVAMPFSRGSSQPRDWTQVSWIAGRFFTIWATRETVYIKTYIFLHSLRGRGRHNCSTPYFSNLLHKYLNLHS